MPLDPFGESRPATLAESFPAFGARFDLHADAPELMALAREAYAGLPAQLPVGRVPRCTVELRLTESHPGELAGDEPPPLRTQGGAGVLCGVVDAGNFVVVQPQARRALVALSPTMLARHRYHARYELLEFALFTLACRALGRMPLHAACVGLRGRGLLLLGDSGAGKSTLALHAMFEGLELLTEDATFVQPRSLRATGVPNYLHLRAQALAWLDDPAFARAVSAAPVIRRRSGEQKFELDLRQPGCRPAGGALALAGVVLLSPEGAARGRPLLQPLSPAALAQRLEASQPYAQGMAGWGAFATRLARLPAARLLRGGHPREGAQALKAWLQDHGAGTAAAGRALR